MSKEDLIEMVQEDLKNERKHLAFYAQAAVMVEGLHREELREFFEEQAADELKHVLEFSELIVHLGGVPLTEVNPYPHDLSNPEDLLKYAMEMEQEVADIYARRLRTTESMLSSSMAYTHVFYEDQIKDSWHTAQEISKMIGE